MASEILSGVSSVPLYQQVAQYLRQRLADGTYPPASALPSEMELVSLLGVSRPTVRRALELLIQENVIQRVPGRGTFAVEAPGKLTLKKTGNIGLIVLEMRDHFVMRIVNGAEHVLAEKGFRPVLFNSGNEIGTEQRKLREMWETHTVDGFLIMPSDSPLAPAALVELLAEGVPLVLVDRYFEDCSAPFVASDDLRGGQLVAEHLLSLGHRRVGFVTRPDIYISSVAQRLRGFRETLVSAGVEFDASLIFQGLLPFLSQKHFQEHQLCFLAQFEREAICDYLARPDRPSAIFACNDHIAVRVMEACREMGLRIPEDIALVGYADEPVASVLTPPLTTVRQNPYDMGARAASKLLDLLAGRPVDRVTLLPVELIVRGSCGARA